MLSCEWRIISFRPKLVCDAIRLLSFGPRLDDVDPADLRRVPQLRPAARAVVLGPDQDYSQPPDGGRDQIQEGAGSDLRVDEHPDFLKDANFVGGFSRTSARRLDR